MRLSQQLHKEKNIHILKELILLVPQEQKTLMMTGLEMTVP